MKSGTKAAIALIGVGGAAVVGYYLWTQQPTGCTEDQVKSVQYCPDGVTWETRERCVSGVWVPETNPAGCGGGALAVTVHPATVGHGANLYWTVSGCTTGQPVHLAVEWIVDGTLYHLDFGPDLNCPVTDAYFPVGDNIPSGPCTLIVTQGSSSGQASFTVS